MPLRPRPSLGSKSEPIWYDGKSRRAGFTMPACSRRCARCRATASSQSAHRAHAYDDRPLPIAHGQTISQPYIVALMTELANVKPGYTVLEVGTGSGYQAAVLAEMGVKVFSIEIVESLAKEANALLSDLGYGKRVNVRHGDGYAGWPEHAPFDAVIVTAAPPKIPEPLKQQLKVGGRLVIPVGKYYQSLIQVTRTKSGFREKSVIPVRFVPMTGKAQER